MKGPLAFLLAALAAAALFTLAPGVDLWFSGLFWTPQSGFFLAAWGPVRFLFRAVPVIAWAAGVGTLAALLLAVLGSRRFGGKARACLYLLLALALGPGLLVNTGLKDHWGRARPVQVSAFGGGKDFTPALEPAAECQRNCSFVSGHAALGFSLIAFAFLVPTRRRRRIAILAAVAAGALFGLARIAQGGHFLSDVVFAGFLVTAICWLLHRLIVASDLLLHLVRRGQSWASAAPRRRLLAESAAAAAAIAVSMRFFDRPLAIFCHGLGEPVHAVFRAITELGVGLGWIFGAWLVWLGLLAAARLPRLAERASALVAYSWLAAFLFVAVAASGLVVDLVKITAGRTRPKLLFLDGSAGFTGWSLQADHWSFPSGHTATAVAVALVAMAIWPRLRVPAVLFALLVAASRVIITQHYLSDVVMGAFIAWVTTRSLSALMLKNGIDLAAAAAGTPPQWRLARVRPSDSP
ncbi:MAG TPA: phosphatase PAP2 family protein [Stellaceae bacterium]|nr:phosphatase PAP2 family protein [Stellaceae bacterium]